MSPPTTPGRFMGIPSRPGRAGTPIPESGLAVLTFPSASDLALGGLAALDGAGATGDLTGTAATPFITMAGITRGAEPFITGAVSTEEEGHAEAPMPGAAEFTTVRAQPSGRSTETRTPLADIPNHADKAACALALLAATVTVGRLGTSRRAARPASAEEPAAEEPAAEEAEAAGIDNSGQLKFQAKKEDEI
jgi:hypothetical protein